MLQERTWAGAGWKVTSDTDEQNAAGAFNPCKPASQCKHASDGLASLAIVHTLEVAGLDSQDESIQTFSDGLLASALVGQHQQDNTTQRRSGSKAG